MPSWFWHKRCDFWTKYYNLWTKDCILHVSHVKRNLITHSRFVQSGLHAVTWVMVPCATPVRQNLIGNRYKQHDLDSWWRYSVILHAILILYFVSTVFVIFLLLIRCRRSFFWGRPHQFCDGTRSQNTQWLVSRSPIGWQLNYAARWSINAMPSRHASFFG